MPQPLFPEVQRTVESALAAGDGAAALAALRPAARVVAAEDGPGFRAIVARLPEELWAADLVIASALGASFRSVGSPRGAAALGYFTAAEAALDAAPRDADPDRVTVWLGHAAALRSLGRFTSAAACLARARELGASGVALPVPTRVALDARGSLEAGMIDLQVGRLDDARAHLEFALGLAPASLTPAEHVECLGGLAVVEYFAAELATADHLVAEARALAIEAGVADTPFLAPALVVEALVASERHELERAVSLEAGMLDASAHTEWNALARVVVAHVRVLERRLVDGLDELERARQELRGWEEARLALDAADLLRAGILIALDHGDEAWEILRGVDPLPRHPLCPPRLTALLRFGHGDLAGAADALRACEALGDEHSPRTLMDVRLLRGAIEFERGELTLSDTMVDRALATMARTGSRAPLRGIPAGTLAGIAARALARSPSAEARRILDAVAEATDGAGRLIEPLSRRELLVLAEVEKGATVPGIAAALYISPNTVKTHLRRLYRKLGVASRSEAIRKARSLGLGGAITPESPVPLNADTPL